MASHKRTKPQDSLVEQLCSITGVDRVVATNLLEACDNDLEMALNMQMEGLITEPNCDNMNSDCVRDPIPQKQEILVETPENFSYSFRNRIKTTRSVFDKFRDFESEMQRQEEMMNDENAASTSQCKRAKRLKRLEDLFRPPLQLIFRGNFQAARDAGVSAKKWLMVNVQNSNEFPCQVLNRDVWSNSAVQSIVKEQFIFWQVYHDSDDGQRYMTFYPVNDWPYIAIIDPRTGESLGHWNRMDAVSFCDIIPDFIASHPPIGETAAPPSRPAFSSSTKTNTSVLDADESAQIEAAIKASLEASSAEAPPPRPAQDDDEDEGWLSNDCETFESDGEAPDPPAALNGRGPEDAEREKVPGGAVRASKTAASSGADTEISASQRNCHATTEPVKSALVKGTHCGEVPSKNSRHDVEFEEEETAAGNASQEWERHLGSVEDPISKLMLRFPDGSRDSVHMPSTSKLMALVLYVASKGYSNERFELVANFPKRRLSYLDFHTTLKHVGLYPQETVFVEKR